MAIADTHVLQVREQGASNWNAVPGGELTSFDGANHNVGEQLAAGHYERRVLVLDSEGNEIFADIPVPFEVPHALMTFDAPDNTSLDDYINNEMYEVLVSPVLEGTGGTIQQSSYFSDMELQGETDGVSYEIGGGCDMKWHWWMTDSGVWSAGHQHQYSIRDQNDVGVDLRYRLARYEVHEVNSDGTSNQTASIEFPDAEWTVWHDDEGRYLPKGEYIHETELHIYHDGNDWRMDGYFNGWTMFEAVQMNNPDNTPMRHMFEQNSALRTGLIEVMS